MYLVRPAHWYAQESDKVLFFISSPHVINISEQRTIYKLLIIDVILYRKQILLISDATLRERVFKVTYLIL